MREQLFDKTEDHKTSEEPPQESLIVDIDSSKPQDQIIEGYQAVDEFQYSSDGYISKTYDPDAWTKRRLEQGITIITVNPLVWRGLPEYERILWGRLADIEQVESTSPRLIKKVMQEAQKAIQGAKDEIELAEEMDQIMFYSKVLGLLLWTRDGHSGQNRDMVRQLVKDKIKPVHPFPYVDKCLQIAEWNEPMWNTEGFSSSISQAVKNHYEGELKNLEAERMIVKPTEQELLWAKQHE